MFKKMLLLAVAVFCLGNTSCDLIPSDNQFSYNVPFQLSVNEVMASNDGKLQVVFLEVVNDSRCPEDVVCITAGNAEIRVGVETPDTQLEITLNSTDGPREQSVNSWVIRLIELHPQTRSDLQIKPEDYRLTLQVEN